MSVDQAGRWQWQQESMRKGEEFEGKVCKTKNLLCFLRSLFMLWRATARCHPDRWTTPQGLPDINTAARSTQDLNTATSNSRQVILPDQVISEEVARTRSDSLVHPATGSEMRAGESQMDTMYLS